MPFSSLEYVKNKTKENILENPDDIINSIEIGKKYEIKGEDFNLTIQPTNSSFNESSTHIDFSECEKILRQNPNISTSILTILQLEIENKNNNSLVDNLEYLIYDEKKNKVDLSVCKNISTQQYLKLKNDFDLSNYNNYKTSGIDIFNINDLFFNDICHPYLDSETNNDVVLKDRIKDIYQNYTLCNEGCSYTEINTEYKTVSCNCQIKTNISLEDNYTSNSPKLDEIEVDSNFALIKCSNLVFSYKGKSKNAGFWIFLFLVMGNIPLIFLYFYKGIKSIKEHIINEMKKSGYINGDNNNKNDSNYQNLNLKKIHVKKKLNLSFPPRKSIKMGNNSKLYERSLISNAKGSERQIIGDINNNEDNNVNDINNINIIDDEINNNDKNKINLKKSKKKDVNKTQRNSRTINKEISNQIFINNVISFKQPKNKKNKKKRNSQILTTQRNTNIKKEKSSNNKEEKLNEKENNIYNFSIININLNNINDYTPKNSLHVLNNYTFEEAIKNDNRTIMSIFYIFLLSKQAICHAFLFRSPLEIFPLRFSLLLFIFSSDLALNAFFYFDDKISEKYRYTKSLFLFAFSNNLTVILLSTLIGFIFMTVFTNLSNATNSIRNVFRKEEEKIIKDKKYKVSEERKKEIMNEIEKILKKNKIKVIILISIESILMLFFWYYSTAFCHVYPGTQSSWIFDSFLSMLSRLVIELLLSLGFAKLYRIAVEANSHCIYKFVLFFYCFG